MEDYKSNSYKSREKKEKTPVVKKVVSGNVRVKKQKKSNLEKAAEIFIGEDLNKVKERLIKDVIISNAKRALFDIITNGADAIIYGGKGSRKRPDGTRVSYRTYYEDDRRDNSGTTYTGRSIYNFENLLFDKRSDADAVLDSMQDMIDQFGMVSVADLYDLADVNIDNTTASNYGWKSIATAKAVATPDGYILSLTKPIYLN